MNKQTFVTTPQGTATLEQYGSFNDMKKRVNLSSSWSSVTFSTVASNGRRKQITYQNQQEFPLPSLEHTNAHLQSGFMQRMEDKRERDKERSAEIQRIRNYSDHELLTMARLLRLRMMENNEANYTQLDLYQAVLEEIDRRKEVK